LQQLVVAGLRAPSLFVLFLYFKEKLRELGGLDAVFEVTMNCHSVVEV